MKAQKTKSRQKEQTQNGKKIEGEKTKSKRDEKSKRQQVEKTNRGKLNCDEIEIKVNSRMQTLGSIFSETSS